jgi:hypothetical protein
MMNAKQFAWMYLLKFGQYNVKPSYYGGYEVHNGGRMSPSPTYDQMVISKKVAIGDLREFGVDWERTKAPSSDYYYEFQGTFCDASQTEYLSGTIFLKDGSEQFWCGEPPIDNVFAMMENIDIFKTEFEHVLK